MASKKDTNIMDYIEIQKLTKDNILVFKLSEVEGQSSYDSVVELMKEIKKPLGEAGIRFMVIPSNSNIEVEAMVVPTENEVCEAIATFFKNKKGKIYFKEKAADKTYNGKYEWYFWYNGTIKKNGQTYREIKVLRKDFESYPTSLISLIGRFVESRENTINKE